MAVRNLGDWSPLDLDSDPVYADLDAVDQAGVHYQDIATTIDDAVTKLGKIVSTGSDSLAGKYVDGLRSDAQSLQDSLTKAHKRYQDVATQINAYEPALQNALYYTKKALDNARTAQDAQNKAQGMEDGKKNDDGTMTDAERQKADSKNKAIAEANDSMSAAKSLLNTTMNELNSAGKAFGDAVNSKNYDDGLSDSLKDKVDAVMGKISEAFGWIGLVLGVLAILIPGVDAIVLAGVVAGAVALVANVTLYVDGQGSLVDVVLGAVGLGLAGLGGIASIVSKGGIGKAISGIAAGGKGTGVAVRGGGTDIEMVPLRPPSAGAAGRPIPNYSRPFGPGNRPSPNFSRPFGPENKGPRPAPGARPGAGPAADKPPAWRWYNNPLTNWGIGKLGYPIPTTGLWGTLSGQAKDAWALFRSNPGQFFKDWGGNIAAGLVGLGPSKDLAAIMQAGGLGSFVPISYAWGGLNSAFGIGGLIYTGGRLNHWIPAVNP